MGELARQAAVGRPVVTSLVDGLVERGMLARKPVPGDRRGIRLSLTRIGRAVLQQVEERLAERISRLVGPGKDIPIALLRLASIEKALDRQIEQEFASGQRRSARSRTNTSLRRNPCPT